MTGLNKSLVFCLFTFSLLLNLSSVEAKSKKKRYIPCLTQKKKSWLKKLKTRPLRVRTKALSPNDIKITEERDINFSVDPEKLAQGYVQYSNAVYTDKMMEKFRSSPFGRLDVFGYNKMKKRAISVFRYAYITPRKNIDYYTLKRMTSSSFLQKTILGLEKLKKSYVDSECPYSANTFVTALNMGALKIGTVKFEGVYFAIDKKTQIGTSTSSMEINNYFHPKYMGKLGAPEKVFFLKLMEEKKLIQGGLFLVQNWPLKGGGTLVLTTRMMVVKVDDLPYLPWSVINASNKTRDVDGMVFTIKNVWKEKN